MKSIHSENVERENSRSINPKLSVKLEKSAEFDKLTENIQLKSWSGNKSNKALNLLFIPIFKGKKNNQTFIHQFIFFDLRIRIAHFMLEEVDVRSVFEFTFFSLLFSLSSFFFYFLFMNLFSNVLRGSLYFMISLSCILSFSYAFNSLYLCFMFCRWSNLFLSKLFM